MAISRRGILAGGAALPLVATAASAKTLAKPHVSSADLFGPKPGEARLHSNENPYGPSPRAVRAVQEIAAKGSYYPGNAAGLLAERIAERHGLTPDHVVVGAGSMEVLCAATSAFGADGPILAPDLFWDAPARFAERRGIAVERVPMRDDLHIDLAAMRRAHRADHGLVHIVNPNNPTGLELPPEELRMFVDEKSERTVVLVDEAYLELAERPEEASMVDLVRAGKNVVITRTFSKIYGLAGLRVGYAIAQPDAIRRMRGQMTSFGGNMAGLAAALASYGDDGFLDMSRRMVIEGRRMVMNGVTAAGLTALPSSTNFVLVKVPDADAVRDGMRARGVLIRGAFGDWTEWSRVSLGTPEDLSRYVTALPEVIAGIG